MARILPHTSLSREQTCSRNTFSNRTKLLTCFVPLSCPAVPTSPGTLSHCLAQSAPWQPVHWNGCRHIQYDDQRASHKPECSKDINHKPPVSKLAHDCLESQKLCIGTPRG